MKPAFESLVLIDHPYASASLLDTIHRQGLPVVQTGPAMKQGLRPGPHVVSENDAVSLGRNADRLRLYTNSENALAWVDQHLGTTRAARAASLFKDKVRFRRATEQLDPGFRFLELSLDQLLKTDPAVLPMPCVLKPAVGFFSLGVRRIECPEQWVSAATEVLADLERARDLYPSVVLDGTRFIVEACLEGDEYAVDAYFDGDGRPVVVGIMKHLFAGPDDVSDRVYTTSPAVMRKMLPHAVSYLERLGGLIELSDTVMHVELRVGDDGIARAIEVNPLRFGGWCTTADLAVHAWGFDPLLAYLRDELPDWPKLMEERAGRAFSVVVLDNATGIDGKDILAFDLVGAAAGFSKVLDVRPVDSRVHPLFGFLFIETPEDDDTELLAILGDDLLAHVRGGS